MSNGRSRPSSTSRTRGSRRDEDRQPARLRPRSRWTTARRAIGSARTSLGSATGASLDRSGRLRARAGRGDVAVPLRAHGGGVADRARGRGDVRTPDGERVLRAGDVACFPAGAAGAHAVRNAGAIDGALRDAVRAARHTETPPCTPTAASSRSPGRASGIAAGSVSRSSTGRASRERRQPLHASRCRRTRTIPTATARRYVRVGPLVGARAARAVGL